MKPYYEADRVVLHLGDCRDVLALLADSSVDAAVCDPPYELGFMGKTWDGSGIAYSVPMWREVRRVLKPGGHIAAFGGTRTYHRMACAIEDAGFEIRDSLIWMYGSGFPKSLDVSKAIDKAAGHWRGRAGDVSSENGAMGGPNYDRTSKGEPITATATATAWDGWGTALKPAYEPIVLARKPLIGTVAANVLTHGTGAINVDACRIGTSDGRWPANVLLDEEAAALLDAQTGDAGAGGRASGPSLESPYDNAFTYGARRGTSEPAPFYDDSGGPSRFFYTAKASRTEREAGVDVDPARRTDSDSRQDGAPGSDNPRLRVNERRNDHPTVKPVDLMRWLCRLVTPPGGIICDPFLGSGSTAMAALDEGFRCIGIEREPRYIAIARDRITHRHLLEVRASEATAENPQGSLL